MDRPTSHALRIEMFGGFRSRLGGQPPVELPRQQAGALLAHLALNLHRSQAREELCALFWPDDEPEVVRHKLRDALRMLTLAYERLGEYEKSIESARRAVAREPLCEEAHADLMRIHARLRQSSAALRQYRELERILAEEIGEQPSEETRNLLVT